MPNPPHPAERVEGCPKHMAFGPCGGVSTDGGCELDGALRCPFVGRPLVRWGPAATAVPFVADTTPLVLTDFGVRPYDLTSVRAITAILAPAATGLLVGEHQNRPDFPPTLLAAEILRSGGRPWITVTCRDRNGVVLEQEMAGLRALSVPAVLCVTGDARGPGTRPGATEVFDLDGTRLAALAAAAGLVAAVPEAPAAPPVSLRPGRVAEKQRAGASVCVLNHVPHPADVAAFVAAARRAGATLPFVAAVAVYTDARSAAVLDAFPGLALDRSLVAAVLGSRDPVRAGIEAALTEARALLAIDGVVGVNLSGPASSAGLEQAAHVKATVGRELLG